jgi:hypothetical protein
MLFFPDRDWVSGDLTDYSSGSAVPDILDIGQQYNTQGDLV